MEKGAPNLAELSPSEKLLLVGDLWDDLAKSPQTLALSTDQKRDLILRYREYQANPDEGDEWEVVKRRLLKGT